MTVKNRCARDGAVEIGAAIYVREIPFFWSRSRAVFMQWLNPAERCYRRDGRRGLSSDAPANRDARERRAKFFSPEIFGPSK
jgi:hypothetical protein